ncbi:pimeloyl-ACP methyl ester carboxylesterase [Kitasatospora herbaricolor]|uniref:alpha/beta fold hydrolase n=1 Tax=Kitasatospora herbaricolor TaxID=68217 RepID=UPI00174E3F53|nr:alpha/beta hydrolase [Kitasatospora herbaricolor]MDQ0310472.1 pimeloyl-ACP methyl ester carboxylesterase [Kitasatospora herbaricolor]
MSAEQQVEPMAEGGTRARAEVRTVEIPGAVLAVSGPAGTGSRDGGQLPPALFVHGLGGSSDNWTELMDELSDLVDGEALDLPGFGRSAPPADGNLSLSGHVRAVIGYLEASGRGPVHLFGNSLGGAVAVRLAALRPDLVLSLTLISPALPELPPQRTAWPTGLLAVPGVPALMRRMPSNGRSVEDATEGLLRLVYGDVAAVPEARRAAAVAEYRRRTGLPYAMQVMVGSARGIVSAYTERGEQSLWRQAEQVRVPVLLVYGLKDKLVSYRSARRACAAFADARLLVLPESGHVAMMEYPARVARAARELLAEVSAGPATAGPRAAAGEPAGGVDGAAGGEAAGGGAVGGGDDEVDGGVENVSA